MIPARIKKDLINLFKEMYFTNHNKYWRKMRRSSRYLPYGHYSELQKALRIVAIGYDTIDYLLEIRVNTSTFLTAIYDCPNYNSTEKKEILEKYKDDIDWYAIYQKGLDFDLQVKYYKEIRTAYISKHRYSEAMADETFKDIEREHKIQFLLQEAND